MLNLLSLLYTAECKFLVYSQLQNIPIPLKLFSWLKTTFPRIFAEKFVGTPRYESFRHVIPILLYWRSFNLSKSWISPSVICYTTDKSPYQTSQQNKATLLVWISTILISKNWKRPISRSSSIISLNFKNSLIWYESDF